MSALRIDVIGGCRSIPARSSPCAVRRGRHRRHARNRTAEVRCARPCVARTSHAPAGPAFTPSRPYL